ncbi:MCE family protein [Mycolicibacterium alvei]|uniref:Mce family protein Mce3C n=1 Tax=Mycolicibacterium alvei TaxID=67081 RepID=A0A6N4URE4_9MYCO|nr:MCE family protein [Mycolicibacterium alvei]MCV7002150.1 MCE family protein [Mycolicibacterium alvei]BBX26234.1 Mce family protein Mce3C [Mycolicibacterium alvei]
MRSFEDRNPLVIGAIGLLATATVAAAALNYDRLPFLTAPQTYSAYFAEAGGLIEGSDVQVSGLEVGTVTGVVLDGSRVLVTFKVDRDVRLGDRSEAAVKTKALLGNKTLEVAPRGEGRLSAPIPLERTTSAYQLPDAIGDLAATISGLDTGQLSDSLETLAQTFSHTPPHVTVAVQGVARLSRTLNERDGQLRSLLSNANRVTTVLAERRDQIVGLVADTNALLAELARQGTALEQVSVHVSAVSRQIQGFIDENRNSLRPALEKLNGVLAIVENRKDEVQQSIRGLNDYLMALGETLASGPFFKAYLANLLPGQVIQPFVDAAFSDLGLDPNVLAPSERTDPQVGQPGTPALPVPYPRTGQGGEPNLTLPDAITGKPGDQRYPYREPLPAPPPGGPPPGPPAESAPAPAEVGP